MNRGSQSAVALSYQLSRLAVTCRGMLPIASGCQGLKSPGQRGRKVKSPIKGLLSAISGNKALDRGST